MEKYLPRMYKNLMAIYQALGQENEREVTKEQYQLIDGISVDFGIMQKTRKAYVIRCEFVWDDIGSFSALASFLSHENGNDLSDNVYLHQSENCSVFSKEKLIIGFGIKDLVIVDAGDVMLIMEKSKDQEIKHLFNELKDNDDLIRYL